MRSLLVVSLIFLIVETTTINGQDTSDDVKTRGLLLSLLLAPFKSIRETPASQPQNTEVKDGSIRARLLTPDEGCGISPKTVSTRIVGGTNAKKGAFPWMALIGFIDRRGRISYGCGGSLITSKHVLTAAHCVEPGYTYTVRLGEHDTSTLSDGKHEDVKVVRVDKHPNYSAIDNVNDIAVFTLQRHVNFGLTIRPICLPINEPERSSRFENTKPFVAGWGTLREKGSTSKILQMVQIPVVDNQSCKRAFARVGKVNSARQFSDVVLCAGYPNGGKDSCQGDSGGPLMWPIPKNGESHVYEIGVVSYGIGCARAGLPGVYSRVTHFIDWIQEKIRQ